MKKIVIIGIVCFALGAVYQGFQISYKMGVKSGVERTEECLDHWGIMKHDGWNFYCID